MKKKDGLVVKFIQVVKLELGTISGSATYMATDK